MSPLADIRAFLDALETCHQCGARVMLPNDGPVYCEFDCDSDCEMHEEPECAPLDVLFGKAKAALEALEAQAK